MKHIITISVIALAICSLTSCEKYFEREPSDKFAAETFFKTKLDLEYYTNGLIDVALPGLEATAFGDDQYSDLCSTKDSKSFLYPNDYWSASKGSGWAYSNWGFLRQVAYMLDNMQNAKANVSAEDYNHYEGVARFFRAFSTFNKVRQFGDCFWIDHVISPTDSLILYGPRQDREYIMHNVVEDLEFACKNCLSSGDKVSGTIYVNRYTALALASRICLFEGTYRKYHETNPSTGKAWTGEFESSAQLIQKAYDYSKELVDSKAYSLHGNFRELFTSTDLPGDEVIWGRSCSTDLEVASFITYKYCSSTNKLWGPTKDYVMMFMNADGTPVASGEVSVTQEFNGRDARLAATVLAPGMTKKNASGGSEAFAPDFTWTTTGYQWIKWVVTDFEAMTNGGVARSYNSVPVLRYGEVLLNYAEAAVELGKMDETLWNDTVGALRKTHGKLSSTGYPGSGSYTADSWLKNYYTKDVAHPVSLSDAALEIRRERAVELTMEGDSRNDDLMRWNMGDLVERRYNHQGWKGIWISKAEAASGFSFNGEKYTISKTTGTKKNNYYISSVAADKAFTLSNGSYGYLIYNYQLQWDDKMYLNPIPVSATNVNPNLGQNEGWQWL